MALAPYSMAATLAALELQHWKALLVCHSLSHLIMCNGTWYAHLGILEEDMEHVMCKPSMHFCLVLYCDALPLLCACGSLECVPEPIS